MNLQQDKSDTNDWRVRERLLEPKCSVHRGRFSPDLALTSSFIKKEGFHPNLKSRDDVCHPDANQEPVG